MMTFRKDRFLFQNFERYNLTLYSIVYDSSLQLLIISEQIYFFPLVLWLSSILYPIAINYGSSKGNFFS